MNDKRDTSTAYRCICFNIRRTDRVLTQFYDRLLAPSGLSAPQFILLCSIARVGPVMINVLAELVDTDRTTLTRNLELLARQGLVQSREGEDRRMRLVLLTEKGEQALERAWPLWEKAQARVEGAFGTEHFDALLDELTTVRALIK